MTRPTLLFFLLLLTLGLLTSACNEPAGNLRGEIAIDGSSTVFPLSEAVAEEFFIENRGVRITVGISGTGGGFQKFCRGELDISNASRPIRPSEREACAAAGVEFIELPVAYDALAIVVSDKNDFVDCLTLAELKKIWAPEAAGQIEQWDDVRPSFPNRDLRLYGPATDSGTFEYFTEAVVGKSGASRGDYTASEDDNVLVQGLAADRYGLGYFGLAYYLENQQRLKALEVDAGPGCKAPSEESVRDGSYAPLYRPLFIYVRTDSAMRLEVDALVNFYLEFGGRLAEDVGYVPLTPDVYRLVQSRYDARVTGTLFTEGVSLESDLERLLSRAAD